MNTNFAVRVESMLRRLLPRSDFARSVAILAGSTAVGHALTIAASPILTRIYAVEHFGYLQVYSSVMTFVIGLVALRFEYALLLPPDLDTAAAILVAGFAAVTIVSGVLAAGAAVAISTAVPLGPLEMLRSYLWIIPVAAFGAGAYQIASFWMFRQREYAEAARTKVVQSAAQVAVQLGLGVLGIEPAGLLIGDAVGRSVGGFRLARRVLVTQCHRIRSVRWKKLATTLRRYRAFPVVSSSSTILNTSGSAVPMLMLAAYYGPRVVGMMALVGRVVELPSIFVGQAVSQVYSSEVARLIHTSPHSLVSLFTRSAGKLVRNGVLPYLLLVPVGPWLFEFVFGTQWREAGVYTSMLSPIYFVGFVAWPFMPTLTIIEKQSWQLAWDAGRLCLTAGAVYVAHRLALSARWAVALYGGALLFGYASHLFLSWIALRERSRRPVGVAMPHGAIDLA